MQSRKLIIGANGEEISWKGRPSSQQSVQTKPEQKSEANILTFTSQVLERMNMFPSFRKQFVNLLHLLHEQVVLSGLCLCVFVWQRFCPLLAVNHDKNIESKRS